MNRTNRGGRWTLIVLLALGLGVGCASTPPKKKPTSRQCPACGEIVVSGVDECPSCEAPLAIWGKDVEQK